MIGGDEKTLNGSTHNYNNPININKTRINNINNAPGQVGAHARCTHLSIVFFYPDRFLQNLVYLHLTLDCLKKYLNTKLHLVILNLFSPIFLTNKENRLFVEGYAYQIFLMGHQKVLWDENVMQWGAHKIKHFSQILKQKNKLILQDEDAIKFFSCFLFHPLSDFCVAQLSVAGII